MFLVVLIIFFIIRLIEGWGNVSKIKLIVDSTCDLSADLVARHNIQIMPLYVTLGEDSRRDGVDITVEEVFAHSERTHTTPKTAAVTIADWIELFTPWVQQGYDIVCLTISDKMSSTYANAVIAAREVGGVIEIVDSMNLSTGVGLLALLAGELIDQGLGAAQVAQRLREAAPKVRSSFIIDTLTYLYRGGRCSAVQAFAASALNLKIEIVVADGAMRPNRKYRGSILRSTERYAADILAGAANADTTRVFITHSPSDPRIVEEVKRLVKQSGIFQEVLVTQAGCVIGSHCGPNTIGVLYMEK